MRLQVAAHEELSKKGAREGITLIKNEARALPLSSLTSEDVIAVVGPNACARGNLLGGWSIHWQGPENDAEVPHVATVAEGFAASGAQIVSATGVDVNGVPAGHSAIECAQQATRAIVYVTHLFTLATERTPPATLTQGVSLLVPRVPSIRRPLLPRSAQWSGHAWSYS